MYWTFIACVICTFLLSYPETGYIVQGIDGPIRFTIAMDLALFVALTAILGFFMSLGKAAVYKHIPVYYPDNVGSVGGMVGMIGGLGGFILPICFGVMNDLAKVWTSCFMLLFVIVAISLMWMHFSIIAMERRVHPDLRQRQDFPELATLFPNKQEQQILFSPGEYLVREGEKSNTVYFVTEGEVAIMKDGVEVDRHKSCGIVGELGVLANHPRPASVKCLSNVKAFCVDARDFLKTIDNDPQSLHTMNRVLVEKIESLQTVRSKPTE